MSNFNYDDDSISLTGSPILGTPGTYRLSVDSEHRDPTREAVALATLDHETRRLTAYEQQAADRKQQERIRQAQILETPRFSRPGWIIVVLVELIAVLTALSILTLGSIGFTFSSVMFATACVLVPNALVAGAYAIQDADIRKRARNA